MKIVVKVGTSSLTDKDGLLKTDYIAALAEKISQLQKSGDKIILVSSGAIGTAVGHLKLKRRPDSLKQKQALAAIGQPLIMNAYIRAFQKFNITCAQILVTRDDFENEVKYHNAKNTLYRLIDDKVIAVINENDTVATEEINFGDNDTLAAIVAGAIKADKLVIFTDVDGLYDGAPQKGRLMARIEKITPAIEAMASPKSSSGKGSGGMKTKITAAKIAVSSGVETIIANANKLDKLEEIVKTGKGSTVFCANTVKSSAKKTWLALIK